MRMNVTGMITTQLRSPIPTKVGRHPQNRMNWPMAGAKTIPPNPMPVVDIPMAMPRFLENQLDTAALAGISEQVAEAAPATAYSK